MSELIETINYRDHEIEVFYDTDAESPDVWGNSDNFIVYDHRDFTVKRDGFDASEIFEFFSENKKATLFKGYFIFPLMAYIHGGVSLSLSRGTYPFTCGWDTSFKGFVLVDREKGTWTKDKAHKVADSLVSTWNEYLSGSVYGYDSPAGSCWGFYGDEGMKYMIQEAKAEIDIYIKRKEEEHKRRHCSQLKVWIKHRVPLYVRMAY